MEPFLKSKKWCCFAPLKQKAGWPVDIWASVCVCVCVSVFCCIQCQCYVYSRWHVHILLHAFNIQDGGPELDREDPFGLDHLTSSRLPANFGGILRIIFKEKNKTLHNRAGNTAISSAHSGKRVENSAGFLVFLCRSGTTELCVSSTTQTHRIQPGTDCTCVL